MKNLTSEQVEIIKDQIGESVSYGSMYPNVARTLVEILEAAINYTHSCTELKCDCGNTEDVKNIPICASCYNPHTGEW